VMQGWSLLCVVSLDETPYFTLCHSRICPFRSSLWEVFWSDRIVCRYKCFCQSCLHDLKTDGITCKKGKFLTTQPCWPFFCVRIFEGLKISWLKRSLILWLARTVNICFGYWYQGGLVHLTQELPARFCLLLEVLKSDDHLFSRVCNIKRP